MLPWGLRLGVVGPICWAGVFVRGAVVSVSVDLGFVVWVFVIVCCL